MIRCHVREKKSTINSAYFQESTFFFLFFENVKLLNKIFDKF